MAREENTARKEGESLPGITDDDTAAAGEARAPPLLVGFGNPTVDATVEVSAQEMAELGIAPGTETAGAPQETKERIVRAVLERPQRVLTPGGAALNSMRVAAWAGGKGLRVAFLGSVGRDENAKVLTEAMQQVGVSPLLLEVPGEATGVSATLVDVKSKDRALATVRGAAGAITPDFLATNAAVEAALQEACLLYATAFVLTTPERAACARHLAEVAEARGAAFALNLSSAGMLEKVMPELLFLLPKCRYVFGNIDELRAFARLQPAWQESNDHDMALAQNLAGVTGEGGVVVITAGAKPTLLAPKAGDKRPCLLGVPQVPKKEWVDTNGCGDSFVGGFLCKAAQGAAWRQCVEEGHRCAGLILRRRGCSLPKDHDVAEIE